MPVTKPPDVASDAFRSAKWDELTGGRRLTQSDAPALAMLTQWYKIAAAATDELDGFGGQTAYQNEVGDLKAFPQIATLRTASAEIRQLTRQLGLDGTGGEEGESSGSVLTLVTGNRAKRRAGAAG